MAETSFRQVYDKMHALSVGIGIGELKKKNVSRSPHQLDSEPVSVDFAGSFEESVSNLDFTKSVETLPVKPFKHHQRMRLWHVICAFSLDILLITASLTSLTVAVFYLLDETPQVGLFEGSDEMEEDVLSGSVDIESINSPIIYVLEFLRQFGFRDLFFGVLGISLIYFFLFRILLGFTPGQGVQRLLTPSKKEGNSRMKAC